MGCLTSLGQALCVFRMAGYFPRLVFSTQSRLLQADWLILILENNVNATSNINVPHLLYRIACFCMCSAHTCSELNYILQLPLFVGIIDALSQSGSYDALVSDITSPEFNSNEISLSVMYMHELNRRNQLTNITQTGNTLHTKKYSSALIFATFAS